MESLDNIGDGAPNFSHHQIKTPVLGMGYMLLICWLKVSHRNSQTTWDIVKAMSSSPHTVGKLLL